MLNLPLKMLTMKLKTLASLTLTNSNTQTKGLQMASKMPLNQYYLHSETVL